MSVARYKWAGFGVHATPAVDMEVRECLPRWPFASLALLNAIVAAGWPAFPFCSPGMDADAVNCAAFVVTISADPCVALSYFSSSVFPLRTLEGDLVTRPAAMPSNPLGQELPPSSALLECSAPWPTIWEHFDKGLEVGGGLRLEGMISTEQMIRSSRRARPTERQQTNKKEIGCALDPSFPASAAPCPVRNASPFP